MAILYYRKKNSQLELKGKKWNEESAVCGMVHGTKSLSYMSCVVIMKKTVRGWREFCLGNVIVHILNITLFPGFMLQKSLKAPFFDKGGFCRKTCSQFRLVSLASTEIMTISVKKKKNIFDGNWIWYSMTDRCAVHNPHTHVNQRQH